MKMMFNALALEASKKFGSPKNCPISAGAVQGFLVTSDEEPVEAAFVATKKEEKQDLKKYVSKQKRHGDVRSLILGCLLAQVGKKCINNVPFALATIDTGRLVVVER